MVFETLEVRGGIPLERVAGAARPLDLFRRLFDEAREVGPFECSESPGRFPLSKVDFSTGGSCIKGARRCCSSNCLSECSSNFSTF
jgi:hypothetical protein